MKLSKSKINTYLKCPREFKYRYIDEIIAQDNEYMNLGTIIHEIAEDYAKRYGDNPQMDISYALELIARSRNVNPKDIQNHLDSLASFFREMFISKNYRIFSNEEYLTSEKHNFSGITDLVLEDEDNNLIVIDYKTGSSSSFSKYRLELGYYKMLIESTYPDRKVVNAGILFTKDNKFRLISFENVDDKKKFITQKELDEGISTLYDIRNRINNNQFPAKRQYLCRYCGYEHLCRNF